MKFVFALGLLVFYMQVCSSKIIPIPGKIIKGKYPKPIWGECFRNTQIMCTAAGMRVQYDGENCVDCICDGPYEGVTCCMVEPFPIVCHKRFCDVRLNTETCLYDLTQNPPTAPSGHVKMWHEACRVEGYEIADLPDSWAPDDDFAIGKAEDSKSNSKSNSKSKP